MKSNQMLKRTKKGVVISHYKTSFNSHYKARSIKSSLIVEGNNSRI